MNSKALTTGSAFPPPKPGINRLYGSRVCMFSQRPLLVLLHKGITHEVVNIDLDNKPEWYINLAPKANVPCYVPHDGPLQCYGTAIAEYIDDTDANNPGSLQSTDPDRKAWDRALYEELNPFFSALGKILRGYGVPGKEDQVEDGVNCLLKMITVYESVLANRNTKFFGGATPMMIDFLLWPCMERLPFIRMIAPTVNLSKETSPHMAAWFHAMKEVPAVKATMHDAQWHYDVYHLMKAGKPYQDYKL